MDDTFSLHRDAAAENDTSKHLKLWYRFERSDGIKVTDLSGNNNHGEYVNAPAWSKGIAGDAFSTEGAVPSALSHVKIPKGVLQEAGSLTIAARVKWTDSANINQCLFVLGTEHKNSIFVTPKGYPGKLSAFFNYEEVSPEQNIVQEKVLSAPSELPVNVWKFLIFTFDFDKKTAILYIDGTETARNTDISFNPSSLCKSDKDFSGYIGKSLRWDPPFNGEVEEFRIYNTALNAQEAAALTYEGITDEMLVAVAAADLNPGDLTLVLKNLTLPSGLYGTKITWKSDDPAHLDHTGAIVRPGKTEAEAKVKLTAAITKGQAADTRTFTATILPSGEAPYRLDIKTAETGVKISPRLFGLFFEDINYSLDGGLYPELIQNRSFEYVKSEDDAMVQIPAGLYAWHKLETGGGSVNLKISDTDGIHRNNPNYLTMTAVCAGTGAGVYNTGFPDTAGSSLESVPGICIEENENYDFSFFARNGNYHGELEVSLTSADGSEVYASFAFRNFTGQWQKYGCVLTPKEASSSARLQLLMKDAGVLDIDMVSLFPKKTWKNRKNGVRYDLGRMLEDMKPAFFRFPGGCLVEGRIVSNRYRWKDTVGPLEHRKNTFNNWAFSGAYPYYNQSYGFGFFEYFQLSEDLGAEPVPCINAGISHPAKGTNQPTTVPIEEMGELVQDAVDLADFANSTDMANPWVKLRAEMGHPEPFHLKYIEIGNENGGEEYYDRYRLFSQALRKSHPEIKLIVGGGFGKNDGINLETWSRLQKGTLDADLVDDHYYISPEIFYKSMNQYDNYDRRLGKVFLGEYASWGNSLKNALSESAYMTQLEENGDVVELAAYAPLLAKSNYTQWGTDLIFFNNTAAYGTANYYVQKLFMINKCDVTIPSEIIQYKQEEHRLHGTAGFGTKGSYVQFAEVRVTDDDSKEVLFYFDLVKERTYTYTGSINADNYTLSLKARKLGGEEGFLISLAHKDLDNCLRLNLGGWGNSKSAFEKIRNGRAFLMTPYYDTARYASIKENEWYDIRLVVRSNKVTCYVNGELLFDIVDRIKTGPVYSVAGRDTETSDIIVKVTNPQDTAQLLEINLKDIEYINPEGTKTVLKGSGLNESNSFENPENIIPITTVISGISQYNKMTLEPYSFTVFRFKTK